MSNEKTLQALKDRAKQFSVQLPFMDGRDKGETDELVGTKATIRDYGFLTNEKEETYVAFIVDEIPSKFFFGGTVLTDRMQQLDDEGWRDVINENGLPILMTNAKSKKNNRAYVSVEFFPEV